MHVPFTHWSLAVHAEPVASFATQFGAEQYADDAHSGSVVHVVLHAVAPQAKSPHDDVVPAPHVPVPLQVPVVVCIPPVQDAVPHVVPDAVCSQVAPAAQLPSLPHGGLAVH
jgi:hypothetical protein